MSILWEILAAVQEHARGEGLSPTYISGLFRLILDESLAQQKSQVSESALPRPVSDPRPLDPLIKAMLANKPYPLASRLNPPAGEGGNTVITVGSVRIGDTRPVVIAGPCAVESREQIMEIARFVKSSGAHILRGGCFKPRTSPYSFQGLGTEGLRYLREAGDAFDLPIITEVISPEDLDLVAEYSDILQIGSRNMQNFPLLKKLGNCRRPVMLKRGFMATIDEWLSSAEYILAHGNPQVILCERGIRTFESATRNTLDISAVAVIKERSHLPIIVDPSHASGHWRYIPALSNAAIAMGASGLMVEVHPEPTKALSDGPQALKYPTFRQVMADINAIAQVHNLGQS
jgi:3-deoxy-7-phosphoheptulonate synthase